MSCNNITSLRSYSHTFFFKFLQDIAISPIHQQDPGQRHCVRRLRYSQRSKWLSSPYYTLDMSRLFLHSFTFDWCLNKACYEDLFKYCTKFTWDKLIVAYVNLQTAQWDQIDSNASFISVIWCALMWFVILKWHPRCLTYVIVLTDSFNDQ